MPSPDDYYGPRRGELADALAILGFVLGFFGAAPFGWGALTRSFEDGADATMGVIRFAVTLVLVGLATGGAGYLLGRIIGAVWERGHRRRQVGGKPEAGPDRASETAASPEETVAAVARAWRRDAAALAVVLRRFDRPDEVREMPLGRFEVVRLGGLTIGRATYDPGWRWSEHVGRAKGARFCDVEHVGLVLEGEAVAAMEDGTTHHLTAGTLFHIPPRPHDSWVVGDARYVSLHFLGAERYAR